MMKNLMLGRNSIISLYVLFVFLCLAILASTSCNRQGRGFALPIGEEMNGKVLFQEYACDHCHSVADIEWKGEGSEDIHVALGGEINRIKTYGDLVTSIINPSHRISKRFSEEPASKRVQSAMPFYNNILTVTELVDLTTYLEKQYKLTRPTTHYYPY